MSNVHLLGFGQRVLDITDELLKLRALGEDKTNKFQTLKLELIELQKKLDILSETWPKNFP
jgi:hypothetical protein